MVKSRLSSPGEGEFFNVTDLRAAFESFEAADSLRLDKAGRYLGWKCRTDGGELLGEAVMRALNGDRRCPRHLATVPFLIGVMKSLASEINGNRHSDPLANRTGEDPRSPTGFLATNPTDEPNPEEALMVRQEEEHMEALVAEIESLFADDEQAQQVLMGEMIGRLAEEIRAHGSMDRSTYKTARKRIRRRIDRQYPSGWDR